MQGCGENRYIPDEKAVEFYITPGCYVNVQPREGLMCEVSLDWTVDEFLKDGGVVKFI